MRKLVLLVIAMVVSCGSDKKPPTSGCGPMACTDASKGYDLSGRLGMFVQLFVDVQAAGGIIDQKGLEADLLLLGDVTPQSGGAQLGVQVCDLILPPIPVRNQKPLTFVIDPAL